MLVLRSRKVDDRDDADPMAGTKFEAKASMMECFTVECFWVSAEIVRGIGPDFGSENSQLVVRRRLSSELHQAT